MTTPCSRCFSEGLRFLSPRTGNISRAAVSGMAYPSDNSPLEAWPRSTGYFGRALSLSHNPSEGTEPSTRSSTAITVSRAVTVFLEDAFSVSSMPSFSSGVFANSPKNPLKTAAKTSPMMVAMAPMIYIFAMKWPYSQIKMTSALIVESTPQKNQKACFTGSPLAALQPSRTQAMPGSRPARWERVHAQRCRLR